MSNYSRCGPYDTLRTSVPGTGYRCVGPHAALGSRGSDVHRRHERVRYRRRPSRSPALFRRDDCPGRDPLPLVLLLLVLSCSPVPPLPPPFPPALTPFLLFCLPFFFLPFSSPPLL